MGLKKWWFCRLSRFLSLLGQAQKSPAAVQFKRKQTDLSSPCHHHSLFSSFALFFLLALKTTIISYLFIVYLPYQNNAIKIEYLFFPFLYLWPRIETQYKLLTKCLQWMPKMRHFLQYLVLACFHKNVLALRLFSLPCSAYFSHVPFWLCSYSSLSQANLSALSVSVCTSYEEVRGLCLRLLSVCPWFGLSLLSDPQLAWRGLWATASSIVHHSGFPAGVFLLYRARFSPSHPHPPPQGLVFGSQGQCVPPKQQTAFPIITVPLWPS